MVCRQNVYKENQFDWLPGDVGVVSLQAGRRLWGHPALSHIYMQMCLFHMHGGVFFIGGNIIYILLFRGKKTKEKDI